MASDVATSKSMEVQVPEIGRASLKQAFTRAFAGNLFYIACQGFMIIALARLGTPELLGTFGLGIAVAAPVIEFFGLQLQVLESVDSQKKHSFFEYFRLQCYTSSISFSIVACIALCGPFKREAMIVIVACGLSKVIESASLICHGKMQQAERTDLIAKSLMLRGASGLVAIVVGVWLTGNLAIGVFSMAIAWALVLLFNDYELAVKLEEPAKSVDPIRGRVLWMLAWTALPLGFFVGLNSLTVNAPRYYIESYLGTREQGIFSAFAYLGLAARAFYTSLLNAALSRLADHHSQGEFKAFLRIIGKAFAAITFLGIIGCFGIFLFGNSVLWLFGKDYVDTQNILVLLTAAMAFKTLWMLFVSALYAMKRFALIFLLQIIGGTLLLTLLSCWVQPYGLIGATWAILLGSVFDVCIFLTAVATIVHRHRTSVNLSLELESSGPDGLDEEIKPSSMEAPNR